MFITPDYTPEALAIVEDAVRRYPPAVLFQFGQQRKRSVFEVLIACIISVRTLEEDTLSICDRLFTTARTPTSFVTLSDSELDRLILGTTFPAAKRQQIQGVVQRAIEEFRGEIPADYEVLLTFPGVGPKCAALTLAVTRGETPHTPVDTHVHRVTNRWGIINTRTPEKSMKALDAILTPVQRSEINRLLVPFGKHLCTPILPQCSSCPLASICSRVGVETSR